MNYWKGLFVAAAMDLVWIMGCPSTVTEPGTPTAALVGGFLAPEPARVDVAEILEIDARLNELMIHLSANPTDVDAIEKVARLYMEQGGYDAAIGPLARALQLDPGRRGLWVALDEVLEQNGIKKITDEELVKRADQFAETVASWGHGC
jgi:tetratricopeptide (TPR) repeat protein